MSATILVTNQAPKGHFPALKDASQPWVFASDLLALMPRKEVLAHAQDAIAIINPAKSDLRSLPLLLLGPPPGKYEII